MSFSVCSCRKILTPLQPVTLFKLRGFRKKDGKRQPYEECRGYQSHCVSEHKEKTPTDREYFQNSLATGIRPCDSSQSSEKQQHQRDKTKYAVFCEEPGI